MHAERWPNALAAHPLHPEHTETALRPTSRPASQPDHYRPTSHPVVILGYFLHFGACFLFCFFYKVEKILFCFFYKVEKTCTKISCAPKLATLTGTSTLTEVLRPCTDAHAPTSEHAPTSDHAPHSLDHPYRSPVQSILELP